MNADQAKNWGAETMKLVDGYMAKINELKKDLSPEVQEKIDAELKAANADLKNSMNELGKASDALTNLLKRA
jgi:seryl-tRNA synthetase